MPANVPSIHPGDEVMADFAAGQLHPYRRWLVEAHLELCPRCRGLAARGARLGGAWFDSLGDPSTDGLSTPNVAAGRRDVGGRAPTPDIWSRLESELSMEATATRQALWPDMPLPKAVRREIEAVASDPAWFPVGESLSRVVRVAVDPKEELEFFLVRTPAGGTFPRHRHVHGEDLLVLSGSLRDDYGSLRVGDFGHYPSGSSHAPEIGQEGECFGISCVRGGLVFEY